jgi:hypothetical protein
LMRWPNCAADALAGLARGFHDVCGVARPGSRPLAVTDADPSRLAIEPYRALLLLNVARHRAGGLFFAGPDRDSLRLGPVVQHLRPEGGGHTNWPSGARAMAAPVAAASAGALCCSCLPAGVGGSPRPFDSPCLK